MNRQEFTLLALRVISGEATEREKTRLRELRKKHAPIDLEVRKLDRDYRKTGAAILRHPEIAARGVSAGALDDMKTAVLTSVVQAGQLDAGARDKKVVSFPRFGTFAVPVAAAAALVALAAVILKPDEGQDTIAAESRLTPLDEVVRDRVSGSPPPGAYLLVDGGEASVNGRGLEFVTSTTAPLAGSDRVSIPLGTRGLLVHGGGVERVDGPREIDLDAVLASERKPLPWMLATSFSDFASSLKNWKAPATGGDVPVEDLPWFESIEALAARLVESPGSVSFSHVTELMDKIPSRYHQDPLFSRLRMLALAERDLREPLEELKEAFIRKWR